MSDADNSLLTKEELVKVIEHLAGAYPKYFSLSDEMLIRVYTTYYYFLQDYGRNDVWKVACDLIEKNDTAPTIHMFLEKLNKREKLRCMGVTPDDR